MHAACLPANLSAVRGLLGEGLEAAHCPARHVDVLSESDAHVELAATLAPTTADASGPDAVADRLGQSALMLAATWTVGTTS